MNTEALHFLLQAEQVAIATAYFIFALQLQYAKTKEATKIVFLLQMIFLFCPVCGYIAHAFNFSMFAMFIIHIPLLLFAFWLVITNQATTIVRAINPKI